MMLCELTRYIVCTIDWRKVTGNKSCTVPFVNATLEASVVMWSSAWSWLEWDVASNSSPQPNKNSSLKQRCAYLLWTAFSLKRAQFVAPCWSFGTIYEHYILWDGRRPPILWAAMPLLLCPICCDKVPTMFFAASAKQCLRGWISTDVVENNISLQKALYKAKFTAFNYCFHCHLLRLCHLCQRCHYRSVRPGCWSLRTSYFSILCRLGLPSTH